MRTPPTQKAVKAEIAALTAQRPHVPNSAFGDDNQAAIKAQIDVLKEALSEQQIYERYDVPEQGEDDLSEGAQHTLDAALDALWWIVGSEPQAPSTGWKPIVDRALGKLK